MSFPTRQSHYSRHDNPGRLYLSPDLSIAKMYQMFLTKHDPAYVKRKAKLEADLQDHLKLADEGYASLHKDCEKCKESWSQGNVNVH